MANLAVIFMTLTALFLGVTSTPFQQPLMLLDLTPEEARKYLEQPPFTAPVLSARTASLPLIKYNDPAFRSSESGPLNGHYWKNGIEIDNVNDYVEDVYEASQFHGQDGLGAAAFGYSAPESSRIENIQAGGNVQGSYSFKDPFNQLIKVKYWADSEGFHHEDNIPKVVLHPVEETAEVREARLAHLEAWNEAAALAKANPDPRGEYDPSKYEVVEANEPEPSYEAKPQKKAELKKAGQYQPDEETTGPPRGFFYSFKYPVSILVPKSQAGLGFAPGQIVDDDTIGINAQASNLKIQSVDRPAEVHDSQVPSYRYQ